jgi:hypothetical protein
MGNQYLQSRDTDNIVSNGQTVRDDDRIMFVVMTLT